MALIDSNELRERLQRAERELTGLRDEPGVEDHEYLRLNGKVSGVKLALSYIQDSERTAPKFEPGDTVWVVERRPALITGADPTDPRQPYRVSYDDGALGGWPVGATYEPREG